jgi:sporulation protein YlmC with PRC-barrel domain
MQTTNTPASAARTDDRRETQALIASDKVEGTPVRRSDGEKIGTIERVMIDKRSGKVAYAVMSFGGFLGMGESHYPVPWSALRYDTSLGGYVTGITESQLKNAPQHTESSWGDRDWETRVHEHYQAPYYWDERAASRTF